MIKLGSSITESSPPGRLHELRKRCKELRYLLEFFAPLYETPQRDAPRQDAEAHRTAVGDLKKLQDCLGVFQDSEVQIGALRAAAAAMASEGSAPAPTLLAIGEIAAHLGARGRQARSEFAGRFRVFAARPPLASPAGRRPPLPVSP